MERLCLTLKYSIIQMTYENNVLEFDRFKTSPDKVLKDMFP